MENVITKLLTLREAAAMLNVSPTTLRRWDSAGELPAIRIGRRRDRRYNREELTRLFLNKKGVGK